MKRVTTVDAQRRLALIRQMPKPLPKSERLKLSIKDVQKSGYIELDGNTYFVDDVNRYTDSSSEWFELVLISLVDGLQVYLEWEQDDTLEVFLYEENLKLRDLGLSADLLEEMDDADDNAEYTIHYRGTTLYYEDSGDAKFYRSNQGNGEDYYFWDFFDDDENVCVGVELWNDEYEACFGKTVDANRIVVLTKGGTN